MLFADLGTARRLGGAQALGRAEAAGVHAGSAPRWRQPSSKRPRTPSTGQ
jgi:hypothetical protein